MESNVVIVGAGVSGLTSGVLLAEAGFPCQIWTADHPEDTTSAVAAAIWYPYAAWPRKRILDWARQSYEIFRELATIPQTGVSMRSSLEILHRPEGPPWWCTGIPNWRYAVPEELPRGTRHGVAFESPLAEMPTYLKYLLARYENAGGRLVKRRIAYLDEAANDAIVVNCSGLGSRELVGDPKLYAIRGQTLRVERCGLQKFVLDERHPGGMTYIVPRSEDCILGGTADRDGEDLTPSDSVEERIRENCAALAPALADAPKIDAQVGLRPGRSTVRLETEHLAGGPIAIHNYGHGGAGVTLSWGCAQAVLRRVTRVFRRNAMSLPMDRRT